jgi:hypothetical protein
MDKKVIKSTHDASGRKVDAVTTLYTKPNGILVAEVAAACETSSHIARHTIAPDPARTEAELQAWLDTQRLTTVNHAAGMANHRELLGGLK